MTTPNFSAAQLLDVREIPCAAKIPMIFERWNALAPGDFFVLWNHHEPVHVHNDLKASCPGTFSWELLLNEPDSIQVKISKLKAAEPVTEYSECKGHAH